MPCFLLILDDETVDASFPTPSLGVENTESSSFHCYCPKLDDINSYYNRLRRDASFEESICRAIGFFFDLFKLLVVVFSMAAAPELKGDIGELASSLRILSRKLLPASCFSFMTSMRPLANPFPATSTKFLERVVLASGDVTTSLLFS